MTAPSLTQSELKELLHYDPDTGIFTWCCRKQGVTLGNRVGYLTREGYLRITLKQKHYLTHRLAWLYMYGGWPSLSLDHVNRNRIDNRIDNLREVTFYQNGQNSNLSSANTSGFKGVSWYARDKSWEVQIAFNGMRKFIGRFTDINVAISARKQAEEQYHSHRVVA